MLKFNKASIALKRGHTFEEFVIANNSISTSYEDICKYLKITSGAARAIYDKIYNLPVEKIGAVKKPKLQTVKTGADWRKPIEA